MAQLPGRAGGAARRRRGQQQARTEAVAVAAVTSHLCHMVDRYIAVQRLVLDCFPEYGDATGRVALGARLEQLEALVREASVKAEAAAQS